MAKRRLKREVKKGREVQEFFDGFFLKGFQGELNKCFEEGFKNFE